VWCSGSEVVVADGVVSGAAVFVGFEGPCVAVGFLGGEGSCVGWLVVTVFGVGAHDLLSFFHNWDINWLLRLIGVIIRNSATSKLGTNEYQPPAFHGDGD